MVYKKIANELGDYKDESGMRFDVLQAHQAYTPQGLNAGWDTYQDLETALAAYGLIYEPFKTPAA